MAIREPRLNDVIETTFSVFRLIENPKQSQIFSYAYHNGETEVKELIREIDASKKSVYNYVNELLEQGLLKEASGKPPRAYKVADIELIVTDPSGVQEFTITPALIDAIGASESDDTIEAYIDNHGVDGLAIALEYVKRRFDGRVTRLMMACDLELSSYEAELITQALAPIIGRHGFQTDFNLFSDSPLSFGALSTCHFIDMGAIVAFNRAGNTIFEQLQDLAARLGKPVRIPQPTYVELRKIAERGHSRPPLDSIQDAIDAGWLTVAKPPSSSERLVRTIREDVWRDISRATNRSEIEIDTRETLLPALAAEVLCENQEVQITIYDTDHLVLQTISSNFRDKQLGESIFFVDPVSLPEQI